MRNISIYYNPNENTFEDEDGDSQDDLSSIISDAALAEFKETGGTYYYDSHEIDMRYEIIFPVNDIDRTLYYDMKENRFEDDYGIVVYNIFSIITPNDLYLFKEKKKTIEVYGRYGGTIELVWPSRKR
jgi:hypothetical protein